MQFKIVKYTFDFVGISDHDIAGMNEKLINLVVQ